ncbi:cobalamin biosynthesis protein CobD/CbiB [Amycolatopsis magusensis]|uniref:Cobalamin biosynthesis protein CobD n=1 Tax=Amycolatopsis magusensis TaxID=882444 RepID=A0ABS4PN84_9PSEU|nr:CobD/CbiB family cobalamin biosynthesis protein [Amycolatopsis magusensis]MBP2180884.1 adenosylcobinamide-phosphate synthase [Amycolatopsis magusensis]MDI5975968.1 CobD/CbiB family cobalamin biosynthesis protein [Amycolatopsis magusensis]
MSAGRAIGLLLGVAADGIVGHPKDGRPVAGFARVARALEKRIYADHPVPGAVHAGLLAGGAVVLGVLTERAGRRSPVLQATGTAITTWAVLGGAALAIDGTELARDLETGRLDSARDTLSELDPRDTDGLTVIALSRASVETVAESTSDAVVSPLFWGAVAGAPGLLGARAVKVLRRMNSSPARNQRFGWVVVRLDELINLLPTRLAAALTVSGAPVVGGSAAGAWRAWQRDASAHPSPNAGRVEAAFAGALEIRLGGRTVYPHGVEELPVLGDGRNPDAGHVTRAVELSRVVGWLAGLTSALIALLIGLRHRRP